MNRRKMLAMLGVSPALVAGSRASARPGWKPSPEPSSVDDGRITVMSPGISPKLAARYPLAPPLDNLNSKLIYMINLSWEGPDAGHYFYAAMTEWLERNYPGIRTVQKVTADGMFGLDPAILEEMSAQKADGAIVGVAG